MTGRKFARQRARIIARARSDSHAKRAIAHLAREAGALPVKAGHKLLGHVLPDGFTVCEKRRYASEGAAIAELTGVRAFAHLQPHKTPVRAYACDHCRGWHLTSRE
ncbi:MAG: hypothetical protein DI569_12820 [Sphingopyxis macrogoltabida]|uniref:Uncharacterized protein n=1 Tax=Sphingopyxis macrogoltabida TaxID=33050 RepID=A0A2W5KVV6_SPHMC|nr:MAG: hypothetical protein DI569_12820 [Sphingopyxis macrogoltabida]